MTDQPLSPAAQAVRDAAFSAYWSAEQEAPNDAEVIAAAALRAATDQIETLYCDGDVEDSPGVVFALRQLLLIAAELEAFSS
jgi:hypothetical protein